ncbi:MAG TPA: sulfotransferase [Solirubrobacteraceae bacterium]|nr:sulfotransferase [Solirubrobacteraceae bacterium]
MARRGGPPDYIGLGARGAPVAWWHGLLLRHPAIRGATRLRRELRFFTEFCEREMIDADVVRYHGRFRRGAGEIAGEWSSGYFHQPWTPVLLRRAAPDAKLLLLLTDPFAQYRARVDEGRRQLGAEEAHHYAVDGITRARYGTQLRALREVVEPERILVLQHEQCVRDPLGEYRRTLRFLGVDEDVVPARVREARPPVRRWRGMLRRRRVEPVVLWPEIERTLHDELDPEVEALQAMVPELRLELWPAFAR